MGIRLKYRHRLMILSTMHLYLTGARRDFYKLTYAVLKFSNAHPKKVQHHNNTQHYTDDSI